MRAAMALRRDDLWTRRVTRMVGVSTAAHVLLFGGIALVGAWVATRRPPPIVAYSVELTDLPGTGGRLPGGPGNGLIGRSPAPPKPNAPPAPSLAPALPSPAPAAKPAPPPPPAEAKPAPPPPPPAPVAKPADIAPKPVAKVEPKKVEPAPPPKKAEVKKPEPKKVEAKAKPDPKPAEAAKKTEPKKPETPLPPKAVEPDAATKAAAAAKPPPSAAPPTAVPPGAANASAKTAAPADDYASAAQRFRDRMAAAGTGAGVPGRDVAGGGLGGGVLGAGGDGQGGGRVKSLEWVAYRQRIISTVKERWSNAIKRPGLVTTVRFNIARDGTISRIEVSRASGNTVYDQTAVAAVERVKQLPPPPPAYAEEFAVFEINFHGEETGGVS